MARVTVENDVLRVELEGLQKIWALRGAITVPLVHVRGATAVHPINELTLGSTRPTRQQAAGGDLSKPHLPMGGSCRRNDHGRDHCGDTDQVPSTVRLASSPYEAARWDRLRSVAVLSTRRRRIPGCGTRLMHRVTSNAVGTLLNQSMRDRSGKPPTLRFPAELSCEPTGHR